MARPWSLARTALTGATLAAAVVALSCDDAVSCPGSPCDPLSDGTPFDVIDWCQETGSCRRDGTPVPVCTDTDAAFPAPCALSPAKTGETLTFPIAQLAATLGSRRDLVFTFAACEADGQAPELQKIEVFYDDTPAACALANPCHPGGTPTVMTCRGVPSSVEAVTLSFAYDGAQGKAALHIEMQSSTCSYFCGGPSPRSSATSALAP